MKQKGRSVWRGNWIQTDRFTRRFWKSFRCRSFPESISREIRFPEKEQSIGSKSIHSEKEQSIGSKSIHNKKEIKYRQQGIKKQNIKHRKQNTKYRKQSTRHIEYRIMSCLDSRREKHERISADL